MSSIARNAVSSWKTEAMTRKTGSLLALIAGILGLVFTLIWIFLDQAIALPLVFSLNVITVSAIVLSILLVLMASIAFTSASRVPAYMILGASIVLLFSVYQLFPALLGIAGGITLLGVESLPEEQIDAV